MATTGAEQDGILDTVRRIASSLLAMARNRIELFAVELRIEQDRLVTLLIWLGVGLLLALLGLVVLAVTIAIVVWENARVAGLLGVTVVFLGASAGVLYVVRRRLRTTSRPFPETIAQFTKDCACLKKED